MLPSPLGPAGSRVVPPQGGLKPHRMQSGRENTRHVWITIKTTPKFPFVTEALNLSSALALSTPGPRSIVAASGPHVGRKTNVKCMLSHRVLLSCHTSLTPAQLTLLVFAQKALLPKLSSELLWLLLHTLFPAGASQRGSMRQSWSLGITVRWDLLPVEDAPAA